MKIKGIVDFLKSKVEINGTTCDTYKSGDGENEVTGVVVTMFATPDVIKEAVRLGANFIIVHEPTFYNHWDDSMPYPEVSVEKKKLIDDAGITIFRYHDYAHFGDYDNISLGMFKYMGFDESMGHIEAGTNPGLRINHFILNKPITTLELAKRLEDKLGLRHIRIAGDPNHSGCNISGNFGTPGNLYEDFVTSDFVLTGEICEWEMGQVVKENAQLGHGKAMLVLGHIGSERAGMMYTADILKEKFPDVKFTYVEGGEVYTYTD